ncbi:hypothetical protein AAFF_G00341860 [Aldrovandia affinis]|uniref:Uncharacterized protein n=1 Tax=Aldrovandia affinis TaxID=143900 RepID=A0AAD7WPP2_9TELE|nr:hypothetical protein AAFF_G00341860 [Aldrovandia affinis]
MVDRLSIAPCIFKAYGVEDVPLVKPEKRGAAREPGGLFSFSAGLPSSLQPHTWQEGPAQVMSSPPPGAPFPIVTPDDAPVAGRQPDTPLALLENNL